MSIGNTPVHRSFALWTKRTGRDKCQVRDTSVQDIFGAECISYRTSFGAECIRTGTSFIDIMKLKLIHHTLVLLYLYSSACIDTGYIGAACIQQTMQDHYYCIQEKIFGGHTFVS